MPHKDPVVRRAYLKEYNRRRSREAIARMNEWRKNNPARQKIVAMVNSANMAAKHHGAPGRIGQKDIAALVMKCIYCGSTNRPSLDHLTPFRRGGDNVPSNIAIACVPCNSAKGYLTADEFRVWRARPVAVPTPKENAA